MKLLSPSVELLKQGRHETGMLKHIELAGRTCYKSNDKITDDSCQNFVQRMVASGHDAMLEHGTVYLMFEKTEAAYTKYLSNPYSRTTTVSHFDGRVFYYITTNFRVIIQNGWVGDMAYMCEPTEFHKKRYTVRFITDRGVSHEFVRHRVFSFAQESTRFCNYSLDKFDNELAFIKPSNLQNLDDSYTYGKIRELFQNGDVEAEEYIFVQHLLDCERAYLTLLGKKLNIASVVSDMSIANGEPWLAQQARQVMPNALKTELIMTGYLSDWEHFLSLRSDGATGKPHPDAKHLADKLKQIFKDECIL